MDYKQGILFTQETKLFMLNEKLDIAIARSFSLAEPVLGLDILSIWAGWRDVNILINATALAAWLEGLKGLNQ